MNIGVKYCGGCNPRYDRGRAVRELAAEFPQHTFLFDTEQYCPLWLVVNGCPAACCSSGELRAAEIVSVSDPEGLGRFRQRLLNRSPEEEHSKRCCSRNETASVNRAFFSDRADESGNIPSSCLLELLTGLLAEKLPGEGAELLRLDFREIRPITPYKVVIASVRLASFREEADVWICTFAGACTDDKLDPLLEAEFTMRLPKESFVCR